MPTEPIEDLLPRKQPPEIQKMLDDLSKLIEEVVNFGTHTFDWSVSSVESGNEHAPVFMSFRHILEMLDAISVLERESCFEPAKLLLRSVFESLLNIEFLLSDNLEQRGMDFLFWHLCQNKENMKKVLELKINKARMSKSKFENDPTITDAINAIRTIGIKLSNPRFSNSRSEYSGKKIRHWFNIRNGPNNIADLAERLGEKAKYIILYRQWSQLSHGIDIFRGKLSHAENGGTYFTQLRLPEDCGIFTSLAVSFGLKAIKLLLSFYVEQRLDDFSKWYISEISERYLPLSDIEPIIVI